MAMIEDMGDCLICRQTLTKPEAFQCLHFCCKACVDDLLPTTEGNETGYSCPKCRKFTPKGEMRPMHFVQDLREVVESAKEEPLPCMKCKTEVQAWRCTYCKENYCTSCHKHHDGFSLLKGHDGEKLTVGSSPVMDKPVFCDLHPRKIIEYHCKDCSQLICNTCNGTDHKLHAAESIEDALQKAVPLVKENAQKLGQLITITETALSGSKYRVKELKKEYEDLDEELDRKKKEVAQKTEIDYNTLKSMVHAIRAKQMEEGAEHIKELEMKLQSQKRIADLSDATLSVAQGTSLLHAIQSGLGQGLMTYVNRFTQPMTYADGISAKFARAVDLQENAIGTITEAPTGKYSMHIPLALDDITVIETTLEDTKTTPFKSTRFIAFNDQLWFVGLDTNQIHIWSLEGTPVMTLTFPDIVKARSLVQVKSHVIIAAENGLFAVDYGNKVTKISDGQYCDVSSKGHTLFALDDGQGKVVILGKGASDKEYVATGGFSIVDYKKNTGNTIQVTDTHIFIGHISVHCIIQYDHHGDNAAIRGSAGQGDGQLQHPFLSGADSNGNALIVDHANNRFQTLSASGDWSRLVLGGLATNPWRVVMSGRKLYVQSHSNGNILQIFSLQ